MLPMPPLTATMQAEFAATDSMTRVCAALHRLSRRSGVASGDHVELELPLSQRELAEWSGMSRESFVKALARLRSIGWVEMRGRCFVITDPEALARRAGELEVPQRQTHLPRR